MRDGFVFILKRLVSKDKMPDSEGKSSIHQSKDHLWPQISAMPYFRGLLRAVEARFYQNIELPSPTLDLGCGDGHFATAAFDRKLEVGTDPWWIPLTEAGKRNAYLGLTQSEGAAQPFQDAHFASAVSNSVLEHIPHIEDVLLETARLLKEGAPFVFCVPNHQFLSTLSIGRSLDRIGLTLLGDAYRKFFNCISRHYHCDDPQTWEIRLKKAGFRLEKWWHYFSPSALRVLEWGHYLGLPSLISKKLTGHWILVPQSWNLAPTHRLVEPYYEEPIASEDGVYTFYIARRV
jgi:SAM-dependent methyltransferase